MSSTRVSNPLNMPAFEHLESRRLFAYTGYVVADAAPAVSATVPTGAVVGQPVAISFATAPATTSLPIAGWVINWGQNSATETLPASATTATHTYTIGGPATVQVWAKDSAGHLYKANNGIVDTTYATHNTASSTSKSSAGKLVFEDPNNFYQNVVDMQVDTAHHTTYLLGDSQFKVMRVLADGTLDPSWGVSGVAEKDLSDNSHSVGHMALLADGSVLVAGGFVGDYWCVKYTSAGQLDSSFGVDGVAKLPMGIYESTSADFVFPQSDGKILLLGFWAKDAYATGRETMARLNADGFLDTTYGTGGYQTFTTYPAQTIQSAVMQSDGKIVATLPQSAANNVIVTRLLPSGSIDPTFGNNGYQIIPTAGQGVLNGLAVQSNGYILADGWYFASGTTRDSIAVRLTPGGFLDTTFGTNGVVTLPLSNSDDQFNDITPTADGGALATGYAIIDNPGSTAYVWAAATLAKFDSAGKLDSSSAGGGLQYFQSPDAEYGRFVRVLDGDWILGGAKTPYVPTTDLTVRRLDATAAFQITVKSYPQGVIATTVLTAAEGGSLQLSAAGSTGGSGSAVAKYEWDFNYNSSAFDIDATGATPIFAASALDGLSTRTIALRVTDANGAVSAITTATVTITNVAPTALFVASVPTIRQGQTGLVGFGNIVDSAADVAAVFTFSYDFDNNGTFDLVQTGPVNSGSAAVAASYLASAGVHTIRGRITDKDGGYTDYTTQITVQSSGPTTTTTLQAEDAALSGGTAKATNHGGYTGTGFADYGGNNSAVQFAYNAGTAGAATLSFRYSNGGSTARPLTISVNGTVVGTITGSPTANWDTWANYTLSGINFVAGANTIKAMAGAASGGNLDSLTITASGSTGGGTTNPTTFTPIHIDAGGGASGSYTADASFSGGSSYSSTAAIDTSAVTTPAPQAVYQTERFGNFTYNFAGLTAGKQYTVALHFDELYWTAAGKRVFNVTGNGAAWLTNFDVFAAAGGKNKAITRSFTATADNGGKIAVIFTGVKDNAKVNAIDVVEAAATPVVPASTFINAGGGAVGQFSADTGYSGGKTYSTTATVDTSLRAAPAPAAAYQTERYGNFSYTLQNLVIGQHYLVELDFAETYWNAANQRLFNVLINGQNVLTNYDIFVAAGGKNKAAGQGFDITPDSNGKITITFVSVKDNAKVSAIQVIPVQS